MAGLEAPTEKVYSSFHWTTHHIWSRDTWVPWFAPSGPKFSKSLKPSLWTWLLAPALTCCHSQDVLWFLNVPFYLSCLEHLETVLISSEVMLCSRPETLCFPWCSQDCAHFTYQPHNTAGPGWASGQFTEQQTNRSFLHGLLPNQVYPIQYSCN